MKLKLPLPNQKKLLVIYRLEPDCLGLIGDKQMNKFCAHITKNILPTDSAFIKWTVLPRLNVNEKELEFRVEGMLLTSSQVSRYLYALGCTLNSVKESLNEDIMKHIDRYFNSNKSVF